MYISRSVTVFRLSVGIPDGVTTVLQRNSRLFGGEWWVLLLANASYACSQMAASFLLHLSLPLVISVESTTGTHLVHRMHIWALRMLAKLFRIIIFLEDIIYFGTPRSTMYSVWLMTI